MFNWFYDIQRGILVKGLQNPAPAILPPFYAGQTVEATITALAPTGTPGTPYSVVPILGLLLALSYSQDGSFVTLANTDTFAPSGSGVVGALALPTGIVLPAALAYQEVLLQAQITTADGVTPIETPGVLRNPSFPILGPGGLTQYATAAALAAEITRAEAAEAALGGSGLTRTVTSVGDGATTSLEAIPTVNSPVAICGVYLPGTGKTQLWTLVASNASTAAGASQRPIDYSALTNAKVWFLAFSN